LIYLSPTIQVDVLGHGTAWFPLKNPALVTMPLAFLAGIAVALLAPEARAAQGYALVERQMHLGDGVSVASISAESVPPGL
jgi:cation/acetate symporter